MSIDYRTQGGCLLIIENKGMSIDYRKQGGCLLIIEHKEDVY